MEEVIPGIYQLKAPIWESPLGDTNVYLVRGDQGWLMVDTGLGTREGLDSLGKQLGTLGLGFKDIAQIVVTHIHPDHYGLAGKIRQLSGAKIFSHQEEFAEARYIEADGLLTGTGKSLHEWLRVHGTPPDDLSGLQRALLESMNFAPPAPPDVALHGGERISTGLFDLEVIWTPGHSVGHVCLYEPKKRVLFTGDHILPVITPNVGLSVQSVTNPLADYLSSLRKVAELNVDLVLPAHEHVFRNLKGRVAELFQHHDQRMATIVDAVRGEAKTGYQVATAIPWRAEGVSWENLTDLRQRFLAVMETLAHLELLVADGRLEKVSRDSVILWDIPNS